MVENDNPVSDEKTPIHNTPPRPLQVYIENAKHEEYGGFTMPLPTTSDELQPFLDKIEINGWQDMNIIEVISDISGLGNTVTHALYQSLSPDVLNELNYLAAKINDMHPTEFEVFAAVLEARRHCDSISEIINITENTSYFELQPGYSEEQYGDFLLDMEKDNTAKVFDKLNTSADPDEKYFAEFVLRLEANLNIKAFGRATVEDEKGVFTQYGYLTENPDAFRTIYQGAEDIPAEYRVFNGSKQINQVFNSQIPITDSLIKLENVDLPLLVMKMHALTGNPEAAESSLMTIAEGGNDFFLRLVDNSVTIHSAEDVYYKFSNAYKLWADADTPDVRTFALVFDGRDTSAIGSLHETAPSETRESIEKYGTMRGITDDELRERIKHTISESRWDSMDQYDRHHEKRVIRGFAEEESKQLNKHLFEQRKIYANTGRAVTPEGFLAALNRAFMERAEYSQPDMIRIPHAAAKILLASDTPVFHLAPGGPRQMSTMEAVYGKVWNHKDSAVAIRFEDITALDKWAKQAAGDILRSRERGENKKNHNTEI